MAKENLVEYQHDFEAEEQEDYDFGDDLEGNAEVKVDDDNDDQPLEETSTVEEDADNQPQAPAPATVTTKTVRAVVMYPTTKAPPHTQPPPHTLAGTNASTACSFNHCHPPSTCPGAGHRTHPPRAVAIAAHPCAQHPRQHNRHGGARPARATGRYSS